uniref:C2H2-type domain-containing protein n=1 Tax=Setaria digitata TaxID=48799 RepID=A0A915PPJ1_9BILA
MRTLIAESKDSIQLIWGKGNFQVNEIYCHYKNKHFFINKRNKDDKNEKTLSHRLQNSQEVLPLVLEISIKLPKIPIYSAAVNFSNIMDPHQQRLLAQILQQQDHKTIELKEYQDPLDRLQQQIQYPETMFWFSPFVMQRNGTVYPNVLENLNSSTVPSTTVNNRYQIFPGFSSTVGIVNTNYLPAVVAPITIPSLNALSTNKVQINELISNVVADKLQKTADSANQTWQNFTRYREIPLAQLARQHGLHQQAPSVSPLTKKRISESVQEAAKSPQISVIKRAKVIVIEQNNQEPTPCCSSNDFSKRSTLQRIERKQGKTKKPASNIYEKRRSKHVDCGGDKGIANQCVNGEDEDSEDVQYVDVESVEEKLDTKEQRKALIEFYRKMKTIRMSYAREDLLICQMCEQKVQNSDSLILIHLYGHAEVMPYRCKMCGAGECQLERIYAHIRQGHPNKDPSTTYENRRNMAKLISLLRTCFPRNVNKSKAAYSDLIDKICDRAKEKSLAKLTCMACARKISTRKKSLLRHAQTHLHYRCKECGITLFGETIIAEHGSEKHGIADPQGSTHYDACANTSDKRETALKNCFGNLLDGKS